MGKRTVVDTGLRCAARKHHEMTTHSKRRTRETGEGAGTTVYLLTFPYITYS